MQPILSDRGTSMEYLNALLEKNIYEYAVRPTILKHNHSRNIIPKYYWNSPPPHPPATKFAVNSVSVNICYVSLDSRLVGIFIADGL